MTTAARRWVGNNSPEITSGFDQEAAASVVARLAIHKAERDLAHDVIRWLDKMLISFASKLDWEIMCHNIHLHAVYHPISRYIHNLCITYGDHSSLMSLGKITYIPIEI